MHNLRKIKLILSIVCMSLGLVATLQSCVKAWTWEDMISYAQEIKENTSLFNNSETRNTANYFINNQQAIRSQIFAKGYEVNDYSSFIFYYSGSSYQLRCWNDTESSTYSITSTVYNANNINGIQYRGGNNFWTGETSVAMNGYAFTRWFGLQNGTLSNYYTSNLENKLAYINIIPRDNLSSDNIPWYIADSGLGKYYSNYDFYIVNEELLNEERLYKLTQTTTRYGDIFQLAVVNNTMLVNGDTYHIIAKNNSYTIVKSSNFVLSWTTGSGSETIPSGTITNSSGEVTGNIDLTGVESGLNNVNTSIENQTQAIISGDEQIINAINSGDEQIINALTDTTIDSGDEPTFEDLPVIEIEDNTADFFTWVLTEFVRVLNSTENVSIDIPIYNTHNLVPSNFWVLDIEPLKTFIQAGWWFVVGVPFLQYMRRVIMHIRGGEIPVSDDKSDLLGNIL